MKALDSLWWLIPMFIVILWTACSLLQLLACTCPEEIVQVLSRSSDSIEWGMTVRNVEVHTEKTEVMPDGTYIENNYVTFEKVDTTSGDSIICPMKFRVDAADIAKFKESTYFFKRRDGNLYLGEWRLYEW